MAVLVKDKVKVDTNIFTRSKNVTVNTVMELALEIIYKRGLPPEPLLQSRKPMEDGFYVWLHERTLREVVLEVSLPDSSKALERWEFVFEYKDDPEETLHQAPTDELGRFCETLNRLPAGASYQILVRLAPRAKRVPGWEPAGLKDLDPTVRKDFGQIGYGHISGQVFYRGGTW